MPTRDEVARQVAKRLGGKYLPHESPLAVGHEKLWNALIDSELRHEADQARIQELREALGNMIGWAKYGQESDPWYFSKEQAPTWEENMKRAEALLSEEKKS